MKIQARLIAGALVLCSALLGPSGQTRAEVDWNARAQREQAAQAAFDAERAAFAPCMDKLRSTPREQWSQADIDGYLAQQLRTLNAWLAVRTSGNIAAPWSLLEVLLKHDEPWEFAYNPLRTDAQGNWLPTREVSASDPFSPGDLIYQFCPPERFSLQEDWPRASSYELSIYGATPDCAGLNGQPAAVTPGNEAWAQVAPGTLLQLGSYSPPMDPEARLPGDSKSALEQARLEYSYREAGIRYYNENLADLPHGSNFRPYWAIRDLGQVLVDTAELAKLEAALRARPREQWTTDEINNYLYKANWLVYGPLLAAQQLSPKAQSLEDLLALKILPGMPANPLNNWQPMRLLKPEDGFSPGDLCLQAAPPAYQNNVNGQFWDNSMVISIYGADPAVTSAEPSMLGELDQSWASLLPGTIYALSTYVEMRAYSEFERVVAWEGVNEERMLRADGSRRRIPPSMASRIIPSAEETLRAASPADYAAELDNYLRKMAMCVYQATELYKYEQGRLPADPRELLGDYLDVWPGDPLHPNADGSWPPLPVALSSSEAGPGALLWEPGRLSPAPWVQASLKQNGGLGDPALAYRVSIMGANGEVLLVIDAPGENPLQYYARSRGKNTDYIEELFTKRAPQRNVWPAGLAK